MLITEEDDEKVGFKFGFQRVFGFRMSDAWRKKAYVLTVQREPYKKDSFRDTDTHGEAFVSRLPVSDVAQALVVTIILHG